MSDLAVFGLVVACRLLVPLLIPRFPLPAVLACLVIDGVDQTVFQRWTDLELTNYQSYDKALDVYYLSIAYLSTLRNWTNRTAIGVARFLFYYRQVGVVLFELTHWRALLLVFPNTFEYFFIFYEAVRLLWDPRRMSRTVVLGAAAAIWVLVKLPQEYWIHIAQRDVTDTVRELRADAPWVLLAGVLLLVVIAWSAFLVLRARLPAPHHGLRLAADPLPGPGRATSRLLGTELAEKIVFVALTCIVFAEMLPNVHARPTQVVVAVAVVVTFTSATGLWTVKHLPTMQSAALTFGVLMVANVVFVSVVDHLFGRDRIAFGSAAALFFLTLLTLMVVLYDRFRPQYRARFPSGRDPIVTDGLAGSPRR